MLYAIESSNTHAQQHSVRCIGVAFSSCRHKFERNENELFIVGDLKTETYPEQSSEEEEIYEVHIA